MNALTVRFWDKVAIGDECWDWTGAIATHGYGVFHTYGASAVARAHRMSWYLTFGFLPEKPFEICHTCDNPRCVRPSHLFAGTRSDNMKDCVAKGRHPRNKTRYLPEGAEWRRRHGYTDQENAHMSQSIVDAFNRLEADELSGVPVFRWPPGYTPSVEDNAKLIAFIEVLRAIPNVEWQTTPDRLLDLLGYSGARSTPVTVPPEGPTPPMTRLS